MRDDVQTAGYRSAIDDDRCPNCLRLDPFEAARLGRTDGCQCSDDEQAYGMVRESITEHLNPPDEDSAEEAILMEAVARAAAFIDAQPCSCDAPEGDVCDRCMALGRFANERLER